MSGREQTQLSQKTIWAAIAAVALVGVGLIGLLIYFITQNGNGNGTATPIAKDTATPTRGPIITILAIKSKAELATVEYNTVVEIRKESLPEGMIDEFFGTKEQLLMLVYGNVQAGFDLEKLEEENLWVNGTRVRLVLPAPEILNSSIDFERSHTVNYENNLLFSQNNPDLQKEAMGEAEKLIEQSALENGILNKANDYGKLYYENFLRSLGFTEVEVVTNAQVFEE
ncbi:MAG: DUF4230 domain-containing protein [Anaerolineae bacterium]|nr:DUF4230 domain-containing protein [Anaerolineae bacterium]